MAYQPAKKTPSLQQWQMLIAITEGAIEALAICLAKMKAGDTISAEEIAIIEAALPGERQDLAHLKQAFRL